MVYNREKEIEEVKVKKECVSVQVIKNESARVLLSKCMNDGEREGGSNR